MPNFRSPGPLGLAPPLPVIPGAFSSAPATPPMRATLASHAALASQSKPVAQETGLRRFLPPDHRLEGDTSMAVAFRKMLVTEYLKEQPSLNQGNAKTPAHDGKLISSRKKLESHVAGTDLTQPIVRRILSPGTVIIQYQRLWGQLGTYLSYEYVSPKAMGIKLTERVQRKFVVLEPLECLETLCATLDDRPAPGVGGKGGGIQLLMPPDWERYVQQNY